MKHETIKQAAATLNRMLAAGFSNEDFEIQATKSGIQLSVRTDPLSIINRAPAIIRAGLGLTISEYPNLGWFVDVDAYPGVRWISNGAYVPDEFEPDYHCELMRRIAAFKQKQAGAEWPVAPTPAFHGCGRLEQAVMATGVMAH